MPVYFAEALHLDAAGKGSECVGRKIKGGGEKADSGQDDGFQQYSALAPVQEAGFPDMYDFSEKDSERKGQDGKEVVECRTEIPLRQVYAEKKHISGLRVGEDLSALKIGIGVHESAGYSQQDSQSYGFGYLKVFFHICLLFFLYKVVQPMERIFFCYNYREIQCLCQFMLQVKIK